LGPTEKVLPEDGDRIHSPKRIVLKNKQDGVFLGGGIKTGQWKTSRNIIVVLMHHRHKLLDLICMIKYFKFHKELENL
jgi:hypothetical protein